MKSFFLLGLLAVVVVCKFWFLSLSLSFSPLHKNFLPLHKFSPFSFCGGSAATVYFYLLLIVEQGVVEVVVVVELRC